MDQKDLFKNYLYLIGPCAKKTFKKQLHRESKGKMNVIPSLKGMKYP